MKFLKYILGSLILIGFISFGIYGSPNKSRSFVEPKSYTDQVMNQRNIAIIQMAAIGYSKSNKIKKVDIIKGTILRPQGWAVPYKGSPTGYVGGYSTGSRIVIVSDPTTGKILNSTIWHEWCESILDSNRFIGDLIARHKEIDKASKMK